MLVIKILIVNYIRIWDLYPGSVTRTEQNLNDQLIQ